MGNRLAWLPVEYFFSVERAPPLRFAAFKAAFPRTTVSLCEAPPPRVLLPILVAVSQSSDILMVDLAGFLEGVMIYRSC